MNFVRFFCLKLNLGAFEAGSHKTSFLGNKKGELVICINGNAKKRIKVASGTSNSFQ